MDVEEDLAGTFFTDYGQVEEAVSLKRKTAIATGDLSLQVTISRKCF